MYLNLLNEKLNSRFYSDTDIIRRVKTVFVKATFYIIFLLVLGSFTIYEGFSDRQALMDLYYSTGGDSWTNRKGWGIGSVSNKWHGVKVDRNGRVIQLNLRENNLAGEIPASLGKLSRLAYLNLKQNQLTGSLPEEIGQLHSLQYLLLSGRSFDPSHVNDHHPGKQDESTNEFTGTLPESWGRLQGLVHLELSHNTLHGSIPVSWGGMKSLQGLWLNGNGLTGVLPDTFDQLVRLRNLSLGHNNFYAEVPSAWSEMRELRFLRLNNNQLEGNFPYSFSNWKHLQIFYVNYNKFTGSFPSFLVSGQLNKLTTIGLAHNNYSGSLPDLSPLVKADIHVIELDFNHFQGPIPAEVTLMTKAIILSFGWNDFEGSLPQKGWSNLYQLRFLRFTSNKLTGAIPGELPDNPNLRWLWFGNNEFTSADPSALSALKSEKLEEVDISDNRLIYKLHIEPAITALSRINFIYHTQAR